MLFIKPNYEKGLVFKPLPLHKTSKLKEKCPFCQAGIPKVEYPKGQYFRVFGDNEQYLFLSNKTIEKIEESTKVKINSVDYIIEKQDNEYTIIKVKNGERSVLSTMQVTEKDFNGIDGNDDIHS